jgi:hypothetical protein
MSFFLFKKSSFSSVLYLFILISSLPRMWQTRSTKVSSWIQLKKSQVMKNFTRLYYPYVAFLGYGFSQDVAWPDGVTGYGETNFVYTERETGRFVFEGEEEIALIRL